MMKDIKSNNAREDIEGIKKDIESLISRLGDLKDDTSDVISDQLQDLSRVIADAAGAAEDIAQTSAEDLYASTRRNPARNLAYALGLGFILACILRK